MDVTGLQSDDYPIGVSEAIPPWREGVSAERSGHPCIIHPKRWASHRTRLPRMQVLSEWLSTELKALQTLPSQGHVLTGRAPGWALRQ